jgi:outer membrane protein insertion porin family
MMRTTGQCSTAFGPRAGHLVTLFAGFLILLAAWLVTAQTARAQDFSFTDVRVEGNLRVDAASIVRIAGIGRGQAVSAGELNDAYQRVVGQGLFETVSFDPQGSTLVIRVQEFPTVNVISFEGNKRINDEKLTELISSKPRFVFSPAQAENDARTIITAYREQGRIAATVTPKIIRRSENRVDLVFEITEGGTVEIERLSFVGNRAFSDRRLRQVLETKQAGLLRTFVRDDTFIADRIDLDKRLLADFYASRGFIDFQVLDATAELSQDRGGFFVSFTVQEGQSFRIGNVTTSSEIPEIDAAEFAAVLRVRPGVTYSPSIVENNIARMENLSARKGLNFISFEPRITRNERDLTLDIDFVLTRGPRVFVERIDIEGNTTTLDQVIRRQFRTVEGDPFDPAEIRQSAERIRALGFFEDAKVDTQPGSNPDQVLVNVDVIEQPTGSLSLGASYAGVDGAAFTLGFQESNFLGRGQGVGLNISVGQDDQNSSIFFSEPGFLGRDLTFTFRAFYNNSTSSGTAAYDTRNIGIVPSLTFPVGVYSRLTVRYGIEQSEVFNVSPQSSVIIQNEADLGDLLSSSVGYSYSYDTRTTGLDPLGGILLRFGQDFSGLGGDVQSVETTALALAERRVFNEEMTLRFALEGGWLSMLDDQTSTVTNRFFANNRIRGFERNGLGPRDLTAVNEDALGGNLYIAARVESEFPLGLPEEYGIKGGLFMDAGSVWSLNDTEGTAGPVDDAFHLRATLGASIFWTTPLGPLRLNFMKAFVQEDYDRDQNFDISVSTEF